MASTTRPLEKSPPIGSSTSISSLLCNRSFSFPFLGDVEERLPEEHVRISGGIEIEGTSSADTGDEDIWRS